MLRKIDELLPSSGDAPLAIFLRAMADGQSVLSSARIPSLKETTDSCSYKEYLQEWKNRRTVRLEQHRTYPFEGSTLERYMLAPGFGIPEGEIEWALLRIDRPSPDRVVEHF
jgi:hypothetical protein